MEIADRYQSPNDVVDADDQHIYLQIALNLQIDPPDLHQHLQIKNHLAIE